MIGNESLDRIVGHVAKLRDPTTRRGFRLAHWRIITRIVQEEYDREIEELDAIKNVLSDPIITEAAGGIVG